MTERASASGATRYRWRRGRPGLRSLTLALTLLLVGTSAPPSTAAPAPPPAAGSLPTAAAPDGRIADLARDLGFELGRIFRFVADEIRYEPYEGILRGALGTLDAGAGNSVDQALLLGALLDESLISYRFARGPLDESDAARLIEAALQDPAEAVAAAEVAFGGGPYPARLEVGQLDPPDPGQVAAIQEAAQAILDKSDDDVADSVALLATALEGAGIKLGNGAQESLTGILPPGEVTGHTWVQVTQGPGWWSLDATPGRVAVPGVALTDASETLTSLPDALRHVVRFEVILEQVRGEELQAGPIVEYTSFADELAGRPITLAHLSPNAIQGLGVAVDSLAGEATLSYHPTLLVPAGTIVSTVAVTFGVDVAGPSLSDVFDTASPDPAALADGEAVAEWVEVTIQSPGAGPVTERRTVFDRMPDAVRHSEAASVADVGPIELAAWAPDGSWVFAPMVGTQSFAITTRPTNAPDMLARSLAPDGEPTAILAASYYGVRDAVAAQLRDDGVVAYVDRPGVVSFRVEVAPDGDEPTATYRLDIWHRSLAAIPARGSTASPAEASVMAGVAEHIAERAALGLGPEDPEGPPPSVGVSAVFEAADAAGIPTLVLRDGIPGSMSLEPGTRVPIEEALRAGDVVIIPAQPVPVAGRERLGWWSVDPVTGSTADRMDDASASETVEITPILRMQLCAVAFLPAIGQIAAAFFEGTAAKVLNVISGAATAFWVWKAAYLPKAVAACMTGA